MSTSTVKNKVEKTKNDTTAATPKQKPVAKKPAAETPTPEGKKKDDLLEAVKDYENARRDISSQSVTEKPEGEKVPEDKPETKKATESGYYINDSLALVNVAEGCPIPDGVKFYKRDEKEAALAEIERLRKESTPPVEMSTDAFSKEILTEFRKRTKAIKNSIGKIDSSFESIAFNLHWINAKQAYKSEGHDTIVEYAAEQFGYQKSTCYSLISVVDRFAKRDEKGAFMEVFEDRVKGFSVSKLSLMINLTDAEIDSLKPSMSVREIKKFVRGLNAKPLPELSEGDGEVPEDEDETPEDENKTPEDSGVVDVDAVISNTLIKCEGKEDYEKKVDRIDEYILRIFKQHPNAVISVSYSVPRTEKKG